MRAICVDDEPLVLQLVVSLCKELPQLTDVKGFGSAAEALEYLERQSVDLAILDIDMPEMNGIELAMKIKEKQPDAAILFLTGYTQYALDAFSVHASGYLLKPINREKLASEVTYAMREHPRKAMGHITAKTFGEFDLFVDGKAVPFSRAKAKELLAFLIDRQGGSVTRTTVFAALWEDACYDRSKQKYLDVVIRSLRDTLASHGADEILVVQKGTLRVRPELLDCDLYRLVKGDADAINSYRGEYMNAYSWASISESWVERKIRNQ
ncbi:MAG: response regulator [Lachnospiraceae bacterium]|nr:response regulator [Lachnospiraceae bacterium]